MANKTIFQLTEALSVTDGYLFEIDTGSGVASRRVAAPLIKTYCVTGLTPQSIGLAATLTTTELDYMDGVTSSVQTQLNGKAASSHAHAPSDITGVTASAAQINILTGATLDTTELNYVDGVTSGIQNQLNGKAASSHSHAPSDITGVTASAAQINILTGATLDTTELNYVDGVTSAIQTQLNAKAGTGITLTAGTGLSGGGDLSANRTFDVDLSDFTADTPVAADTVPFYDISGSDSNKCTITVLNGIIDHGSLAGVSDDDHTAYAKADGTRWTTTATTDRAVYSNSSGTLVVHTATKADLDELAGVATNDQTMRIGRTNVDVSTTGAITLGTTHQNAFIYCTNSSTATYTIPPNSTTAFPTGTEIQFWRSDASVVITEGSGVTLNGHDGTNAITSTATIGTAKTGCCIKKVATDTWICFGAFTSS